jgi:GT2 family glycosyltransferase
MRNAVPLNDLDFSVIVPTFDRPSELAACLGALGQQDYARSAFEVIVVDDGGRDVLDAALACLPAEISRKVLRQTNAGPAAARNLGAANARGTWLAFTDDDCRPAPGWLSAIAGALRHYPECMIGGQTRNGASLNPFAATNQAILEAVYRYYNPDPCHARFFATLNLAMPTAIFRALGGFDPRFRTSEDRELCARWLHHGHRIVHAPQAIVWHDGHRTLAGFWKQHYGYGRGGRRFRELTARRDGFPARLEPAAFYRSLLCSPLRDGVNPSSILLAALVGISQLASACGFWVEGRWPGHCQVAGNSGDSGCPSGRRA